MKDLYAILTKYSKIEFDRKKASKKILLIKHCSDERKIQEMKLELFKISSKLLIKAVNNFFMLTKEYPRNKVIHEHSDIANECWFIFDRCVQNIKVKDHKSYIHYLNTSLNRGIYRVFERNYIKHYDVISSSDSNEVAIMTKTIRNDFDLTDIDLQQNFSDVEIEIINFKVSGEKLNVFLKQSSLSTNQYNEHLDAIKSKMIEMYKKQEESEEYEYNND